MSDSVPLAPIDAILGSMGGPISRVTYIPLTQFESPLRKKVETELRNTMASIQKQLKGLLKEQKKGQPKTKDSANGRFIKKWLRQHVLTDIDQAVAAALLAAKRPCGAQRFKSLRGLKQAATIAGIDYVL